MIRVLHLSHTNIEQDGRILKEMSALEDAGDYDLHAIGIRSEVGSSRSNKLPRAEIRLLAIRSMRARWMPAFIRHPVNLLEVTIRFWWNGRRCRPSVVHCHDATALPAAILIKATTGARLVYDAHELESRKNGQSKAHSILTYACERMAWPFVDHFISVSGSILAWYERTLGHKPMTLVLNSPERSGEVAAGNRDQRFRRMFSIPEDRLVFVYVGVLGPGRGVDIVLSAFSSEQVQSHVVFLGYGDLRGRILEVASEAPNVHLHDPVAHEEVVPLLRGADIGLCIIENVSLSDYYCLPNKLFEYAFAGLPVLASRFPELEIAIEKYRLGRCTGVDAESVVTAVIEMERHRPLPSPVDLTDLSWQEQAANLVSAYRALVGESRTS